MGIFVVSFRSSLDIQEESKTSAPVLVESGLRAVCVFRVPSKNCLMTNPSVLRKPSQEYPESVENRRILQVLDKLQEKLSTEETAEYLASLDSREKLRQLELKEEHLATTIQTTGTVALIGGLGNLSLLWLGLLLAWKHLTRLEKVVRLKNLISTILDEFEEMGVETLPLIEVPGYQPIDLFVRFPGKEFLLFAIRSFGDSKIIYQEQKQLLCCKRRGSFKRWNPDPMQELSEQAYWLRKNRRDLFGSSNGTRKPIAKVLILYPPTRLDEHREELYATVGSSKFLFISREEGACYAINLAQVTDFIRDWITHRQSSETKSKAQSN